MNKKPRQNEIKKKLHERMASRKEANQLRLRGAFVDYHFLDQALQSHSIKILLQENSCHRDMNDRALDDLSTVISKRFKKTFALLLYTDRTDAIRKIRDYSEELSDDVLFSTPLLSSRPYDPELFPWDPQDSMKDVRDSLIRTQWIIPPRLVSHTHQRFPVKDFIFPFEDRPEGINHGSYGTVYKVKIAEGHLEFIDGFDQAKVNTLRARQHENIMPLLASFSAGNFEARTEKDQEEYMYMIMPLADLNLKEWMTYESEEFQTDVQRQEYIYDLMLSITSGLAFIHSQDKNKQIGYHHDIKPANIVRFREGYRVVWKICDFGGGNLKNAHEETGTSTRFGTPKYAPPEHFNDKFGTKKRRSFDIFSLGCVFLELATLWKKGWGNGGLKALEEHIIPANSLTSSGSPGVIYCDNMEKVEKWIETLAKDDSRRFGEVLELIGEMLREDPARRIFAWEIEIDLVILMKVPETTEAWREVIQRFRGIVQSSRKHINRISTTHNPLVRARNKRRPDEFLDLLIKGNWSDRIPGSTKDSRRLSYRLAEPFSNLEMPEDRKISYGRQKENQWIENEFANAPSVGLYGLGGVGKSHLALHYAYQFKVTKITEERKHTFWVNADSKRSLENSYEEIGEVLQWDNSRLLDRMFIYNEVKKWLEDKSNGPWIMVLDGLDSSQVAEDIEPLLPVSGSGQILVTARDRECLGAICDWKCREIKPPELEVSLNIFRLHLKPEFDDEDLEGTYELLKTLWLPLVIKMAATYMNRKQKLNWNMRKDLKSYGFRQIAQFGESQHMKFMKYFLRPLTHQSNKKRKHMPEMNLLCFLACLSKDKIGLKLIQANYEDHAALDTRLANLVNCAFIERIGQDSFRMHKFVQDGVIAWIRETNKTNKEKGLMDCLTTALGALYKRYDEKKREYELGDKVLPLYRSSFELKVPFMPHFARFVEFIRTPRAGRIPDFNFPARALECVETFSRVYMDEGRPQEAVKVLEFAWAHSEEQPKISYANGDTRLNMMSGSNKNDMVKVIAKTRLGRTLADAYTRRGFDGDLVQAKSLLRGRLESLEQLNLQFPSDDHAKREMLLWELRLDLVRLYWETGRFAAAREELRNLDLLEFYFKGKVFRFRRPERLPASIETKESVRKKAKHIGIRRKQYEGLLCLAAGNEHVKTGWPWSRWQARGDWIAANRALSDAREASKQWLPAEKEFLVDIESNIADVNLHLARLLVDADELLQKTEKMLEQHIENLREESIASENRVLEAERKLVQVRIERKGHDIHDEIDTLKRIITACKTRFGKESAQTRSCARILEKAYVKVGRRDEAHKLQREFDLPPIVTDELVSQSRIGRLILSLVALSAPLFMPSAWYRYGIGIRAVQAIQMLVIIILNVPGSRQFLGIS
ncbi:hypothetical protein N0V90_005041 [Kalmusia sp. IMI 367209]|nr:hypothetical protein N0V90_005041 [Kalmusia sp. IMI 367209]